MRRRPRSAARRRRLRGTLVALLLAVGIVVGWWVLAAPEADPSSVLAVEIDPAVIVVRADDHLALHPATGPSTRALILYPGARVPADAYLATLRPLVAETGISVFVPTFPLRLAVLAPARATLIRAENPAVTEWWIGGHSLGGAMAASHVASEPLGAWRGLLLLAAYPSGEGLADRDDLFVLSLVGGADGLTTIADVERRRDLLPERAVIEVLDGVNHAQFARYGRQPGDGVATVDDATATRLIAEALIAAVGRADGG